MHDGEIAFGFSGRAWDEVNHMLVVVQFEPWSSHFGEWEPRYRANGNDFDAEVLGFGYRDGFLAGSSDRLEFPAEKCRVVESLIRRLFASPATLSAGIPFSIQRSRFLGGVHFCEGWIRQS